MMTLKARTNSRPNFPEILRYELFHWGEINPFLPMRTPPFLNDRTLWFAYGRQALRHGLRILGISAGDKVFVPDYICNVIESAFFDLKIEIIYYNIREDLTPNFEDIEKKINSKTKALLTVNYYGIPAPIETIRDFCEAHRLFFIEDNAQGFLSKKNGQRLGTFGDVGFTSVRKSIPIIHGATLFVTPNLGVEMLPYPKEDFPISKSSIKFGLYYLMRALWHLNLPPIRQIRECQRQRELFLWGNTIPSCPDNLMGIRLNPMVPILVKFLNFDKVYQNKKRKYENILAFLRNQDFFSGDNYLKEVPQEVLPFQVPFCLKDKKINKNELLTYLNQNGIEAFYWPDLPQTVVEHPDLYPMANYLKENLIHFPV